MEHRIQKGKPNHSDIAMIEIELDGDDMYKLYIGDMPVLEVKDADGNIIQQIGIKARHVGATR